jgi:parallel beta-helix repeat protein
MRLGVLVLALACSLSAVPAAAVDRVVDDNGVACLSGRPLHTTIGGAVAAAAPGETILVCAGTYTENVAVNKADLTLRAQGLVRLQPGDAFFNGFRVSADGVTIQGFEISGYTNSSGILLEASRADIRDNRVHHNSIGIGVFAGSQNRVRYNVAEENGEGIRVQESSADVMNNTAKGNLYGIRPIACTGVVTVDHNQLLANGSGIFTTVCEGVIISSNTVQGGDGSVFGIYVAHGFDALVKLNLVRNAPTGIQIENMGSGTATFNTVGGSDVGLDVVGSTNVTVTRNNVSRSSIVDCRWDGFGTNVLTKNSCGTQDSTDPFD